MSVHTVLSALGDPTRRQVFERLAHGPRSVGEIAAGLPVSRPAVSQHLKALCEAGLVSWEKSGRQHYYAVRRDELAALRHWLDGFWDTALDSYAEAVRRAVTDDPDRPDDRHHETPTPRSSA
jgi:DNA-binding transcriptional ArsR family regulator